MLEGSLSTGHSTGPAEPSVRVVGRQVGEVRREAAPRFVHKDEGVDSRIRQGVWHADALGADEIQEGRVGTEFRVVLFWVNLARKDKQVEPSVQVVKPGQIPLRKEGEATVRVLVGEGSPARLGTPALVLDIELPRGGEVH